MDYLIKLDALVQEYLDVRDINKIQHLSIEPDYPKVNLFVIDSQRLAGHISPSDGFELAILLSFSKRTNTGQVLHTRAKVLGVLSSFQRFESDASVTYIHKTSNSKSLIIDTIKEVVEGLFPDMDSSRIEVNLSKITGYHTLEDEPST